MGDVTGTTDLGLHWPIKRSFIRYVARMADGQILGGHGVVLLDASTFVFPSEPTDEAGVLAFGGEVRLQAHAGALAVRLARPRVDLNGERATLTVESPEGSGSARAARDVRGLVIRRSRSHDVDRDRRATDRRGAPAVRRVLRRG